MLVGATPLNWDTATICYLAALGLCCCTQACSNCGEWGIPSSCRAGFPTAAASPVAEHALLCMRASVVLARGLGCRMACGIFPDQGSNPCPLHWQADSSPLDHQGSPMFFKGLLKKRFLLGSQIEMHWSYRSIYEELIFLWDWVFSLQEYIFLIGSSSIAFQWNFVILSVEVLHILC